MYSIPRLPLNVNSFFKKIAVSDLARQEKFKILGIANGLPMHYNLLTTIYNAI